MNHATRRALTCAVLVLYGGVTLLDQGLHLLVPTDAHHHHGLEFVGRVTVELRHDCGHGYCRAEQPLLDRQGSSNASCPAVHPGSCAESSHLCLICAFLAQARSGQIQVQTTGDWQPLVTCVAVATEQYSSQALLGPYAPRGPPQLSASRSCV